MNAAGTGSEAADADARAAGGTRVLGAGAADLELAAAALRRGELVAFPTETVYGLGADARNEDAVRAVFAAKGRPADHPLIVHVAGSADLRDWARGDLGRAGLLAGEFWPGPLTLVLPRAASVSNAVTGGQDTVALRMPAHEAALALLETSGLALVGPSANRFGRLSPTSARHVIAELGGQIAFVIDGGDSSVGIESTILDLSRGEPRVLRPGAVGPEAIAAVLGEPVAWGADGDAPRVSGSLASHYAPRAEAVLLAAEDFQAWIREGFPRFARRARPESAATAPRHSALALRPRPAGFAGEWRQLPADPGGYGRRLYATLRELDGLADVIVIEAPPAAAVWSAVHDRLGRAAAPRGTSGT